MDFIGQYLDGLCRTCLIEVEESSYGNNTRTQWQSILDRIPECDTLRIAELLSTAVPQIRIQPSDELPKKICRECLQQLLSAFRFQQMCVQSEKQMRELISTKHTDFNISIIEAFKEHDLETNNMDSTALETAPSSSTQQYLEHPSIQKPLHEITEGMAEDDAVQSSFLEKINEFIKKEPIEEGDAMHSTIPIECKEEEINLSRDDIIAPKEEQLSAADSLESFDELLGHCNDSQGEFTEFIIIEHMKEEVDTMHLTIPIECEEEINVCKYEIIEQEAAQSRAANHLESIDQLPDFEIIKKEPIEDIEPSIEYSDGDIITSTISVAKVEVLAIESEEQHVNMRFSQRPYACAECGKTFSTSSILANHRKIHVEEKAYECTYCTLRFTTNANKCSHEKMHEEVKGAKVLSHKNKDPETRERNIKALREDEAELKQLISKEKTQQASTEKLLELKEYLGIYSENKPYECPYCPLRFRTKRTVRDHKEIHEGVKLAACDICGKKVRKRNLNVHKRTHREEKLHECDLCEKRFTSTLLLGLHRRRHAGEKRYKCKYCKRAYCESTALNLHLRTHLGDNVFRCQFCPLAFPSASQRSLHLPSHKNEDPETRERNIKALQEDEARLRLQISTEKTQQPSTEESDQQLKHSIRHREDMPYECPYCPLRFRTSYNMSQHKQIHEGVKREACDICGKKMRKCNLNRHKLQAHSKVKLHKCDCCEMRFISIQELRLHTNKHTGEKRFKCRYCECAYYSLVGLNNHLRTHLGVNIYRCEFCPLAFPSASERRLHLLLHENEDPETRKRNIKALEEDEAKLGLRISNEKTHHPSTEESDQQLKAYAGGSKKKPFECPYCPLRFRTKRTVRDHKQIHEGVKREACDICGKKMRKASLNRHKLRAHSKVKLHKCDCCEMRFISIQELRFHTNKHTGEKTFKCRYCECAYYNLAGLNYHLRTHLGVNIYRCEFCPLAFPSASERRLHLLSHKNEDPETRELNIKALQEEEAKLHISEQELEEDEDKQHKLQTTYEYPYKCNICNERFNCIENQRLHMRIHSLVYPFKCKYCEFAYNTITALVKHLRTHLGDNVYRCEFCPLAFPSTSERHLHFATHKNEDRQTRKRNIKALREAEAKLMLQISEKNVQLPSTAESE